MKKVIIGVLGIGRGRTMIDYCRKSQNAEVVAICDKWEEGLNSLKIQLNNSNISFYTSFDEFINHEMDAVVLANYATEHAPFAIKCLKGGKHVFSEVLPCQTMQQAVELIETVEETGLIYAYGENYCFMNGPYEMRKLYKEGKIGEFEYGEGEYIHNTKKWRYELTYGERDHWRNNGYSTFYCTHALGPIIHITGLRPIKVTGFEGYVCKRGQETGSKTASPGIIMVTLENGGIFKAIQGGLYKNSIWYSIYGSLGRVETAREDAQCGDCNRVYVNLDEYPDQYFDESTGLKTYEINNEGSEYGHGGSDYWTMFNFCNKILGDDNADIIDVYEALDMFLPGMFGYRSILAGGKSMDVPDLRIKYYRDIYRNDTACTDPKVAGKQLLPCQAIGNPDIPDEVFEREKAKWDKWKEDNLNK